MIALFALLYQLESGATEFEPLVKALAGILGPVKAIKKQIDLPGEAKSATAWYFKDKTGHVTKVAFVENGIYEPNCTHTWVVGLNAKTGVVDQIRVVEMSCPHAFPTKAPSFLAQFIGKSPAETLKQTKQVHTIAKATGSSLLAAKAVERSVTAWKSLGGRW